MRALALIFVLMLAGCASVVETPVAPASEARQPTARTETREAQDRAARRAAKQFVDVVQTVEPVAERECRARAPQMNCDFLIAIDDRAGQPPNAYQTLDDTGRPVIAFTLALIATARNADELAFIMGHETAHHISGHIRRQQAAEIAGAEMFGRLAALTGADARVIERAQALGAAVGARRYSKAFELEADALGTIIAKRAGYDPVRGAAFFTRIPDPGNRFLGTHPPNAERIETVRRVAAAL